MLAAAVAAIWAAGCGGGSGHPHTTTRTEAAPRAARATGRALCARLTARVVGRVRGPAATEISGLVLSRSQKDILWTHNDSGDSPRVLALTPDGRVRSELTVTGAENVDWEDIAIGDGELYIGDIGDNAARRPEIVVYIVAEPRVSAGATAQGATAPAQRVTLRYPDGAHDAEALIVDAAAGEVVIVTKDFGGDAGVYVARPPASGGAATLRRSGRISLGPGAAVTAGDISADGATVVLRTYDRAYVFARRGDESLSRTLRRRPCAAGVDLIDEGQGETLALAPDGRAFYTVPEGARPAIRRYEPAR